VSRSFRTLVLDGSPHPNGDSMNLVRVMLAVFGGGGDFIRLYRDTPRPCRACGACASGLPCLLDNALDGFRERLERADFLLAASPLHFSSLSAPLVAFFSRLQPFWQASRRGERILFPERRLAALATAGGSDYPNMFEPARKVAAAAFATLGIPFAGMATASGTDRLPAAQNSAALAFAAGLAEEMALRAENPKPGAAGRE
jgi:multimeric flavodoxin WrbA